MLSEAEGEKRRLEKEKKIMDENFWPKGANLDVINAKFGTLGKLKDKYCDDAETYCGS